MHTESVLLRPFDIIAEPADVFSRMKEDPKWITSFVVISLLATISAIAIMPFQNHIIGIQMAAAGLEQEKGPWDVDTAQLIQIAGQPLLLLLRISMVTIFLFFLLILLGAKNANGRMIFAVVVHSEMIVIGMELVNAILLYLRGFDSVRSVADLMAIPGLNLLLPEARADAPLRLFLNNFNPFTIWYVYVLGTGLAFVAGLAKMRGLIASSIMWLLKAGFLFAILRVASGK